MIGLIQIELHKTFRQMKLYVFMAILALHTLFTVYFHINGGEGMKSVIVMPNGQSLPLTLISSMAQFMILFIPIYAADMITGEYRNGALKLSLLRPVQRTEWLHAKIVSLIVFIAILIGFAVAADYAIGTLAFGWGEKTLYQDQLYAGNEGIWLTLRLFFSMLLPYTACGIIVVLIAISASKVSTAIGLSIGLLTASQYLNAFEKLKSISVVNQMYFFHENVHHAAWGTILQNLAVMACYIVVGYTISAVILKKKDFIL